MVYSSRFIGTERLKDLARTNPAHNWTGNYLKNSFLDRQKCK